MTMNDDEGALRQGFDKRSEGSLLTTSPQSDGGGNADDSANVHDGTTLYEAQCANDSLAIPTAEVEKRAAERRALFSSQGLRQSTSEVSLEVSPLWPQLGELGLGRELNFVRQAGIGGSDANVILSGDSEKVLRLWREKRGEIEAEDLSDILPVMLGSWTEAFNRQWYEQNTGNLVTQVGASLGCSRHAWRRCTLDGYVKRKKAVFEAKHVNAFAKSEEVLARYMPQLQHNMAVAGANVALLSVIFGNHKWELFEVASDWLYQEDLLIAESRFWDCVRTGEVPVTAPVPEPPVPVGVREVCLEGNNAWASAAGDWLASQDAAKSHKAATATLKGLVEPDVSRAFGHGIEARRNKAGAVSIREEQA